MDNDQIPILPEKQISQMAINQKTLRFVRANPDKFGALLWIKPATEVPELNSKGVARPCRAHVQGFQARAMS